MQIESPELSTNVNYNNVTLHKFSNTKALILSLLVMMLWGSLYPAIKIGYKAFEMNTSSVAEVLMFAGMRFLMCGFIITLLAKLKGEKIDRSIKNSVIPVCLMGLFGIVLHYSLSYIGLTSTASSKTAILKKIGELLFICFPFLFTKDEKFSIQKIIGAFIGFTGVIAINLDSSGIKFFAGDLFIIAASLFAVASNLVSKKAIKCNPVLITTGISQLLGGILLTVFAAFMGASPLFFSARGIPILLYICFASIVSYCLWYYVIGNTLLSKMYIIKFAEPVFSCIFGAILLGENIFTLQYLVAFALVLTGIIIGSK